MSWEKIAVVVVALYLALVLPLNYFYSEAEDRCRTACLSQLGYDLVRKSEFLFTEHEIECGCYDSLTREGNYVTIYMTWSEEKTLQIKKVNMG